MQNKLKKLGKFDDNKGGYNDCPTWRLGLFALNTGIAGLMVTVVGFILTAMRIFDGITDPIVGFLIDKTDGKFGKFRPFIVIGNIILGVMTFANGTYHRRCYYIRT